MTPAEIRELIEKLVDWPKHNDYFDLARAGEDPWAEQAATALDELLARCERMEEALREVDQCLANAGSPVLARKIARAALSEGA